jgi:hypothetical protein
MSSYRDQFPRLGKLIDGRPAGLSDESAFPAIDETIDRWPPKRGFLQGIETELQGLDDEAYTALRAKLTPLPKKAGARGLEPLYDLLGEARAYNHLQRQGCTGLRFVPTAKGRKTPDLEATDPNGSLVLCDAKTINISDAETHRRRSGGVGTSTDQLDDGFFRKLKSDLERATDQMIAFSSDAATRRIAYIIIHYDDSLNEYADRYERQLRQFLAESPTEGIEVMLCVPALYGARVILTEASEQGVEDPFSASTEWDSEADRKDYAKLSAG